MKLFKLFSRPNTSIDWKEGATTNTCCVNSAYFIFGVTSEEVRAGLFKVEEVKE